MRKTKLLDWDVVISAQKETSNNLHMEEGCRIILYSVKVGKCWARRSIFIHVLSSASRESLFLCLLVTTLALWAADLSMLHSQECWGTKSKAFFFFFPTSIPHLPPAMFLLAFSNLQSIRTFADLVGLTFFFLQCFLLVRLESETSIFHDQFSVVLIMAGQIVSEVLGTKTKRWTGGLFLLSTLHHPKTNELGRGA